MDDVFIKKRWDEENIVFYLHFQKNMAIRQIEVNSSEKRYLTESKPTHEDSMLYDQPLESLDIVDVDYISKEEFEKLWNNKENDNQY